MRHETFNELIDDTWDEIVKLCKTKGADYTQGDDDRLDSFKLAARALGLTPEQVWAVYANKHWSAVLTYCKKGQVESEPIESRINDLLLYLLLLKGLIVDNPTIPNSIWPPKFVPEDD